MGETLEKKRSFIFFFFLHLWDYQETKPLLWWFHSFCYFLWAKSGMFWMRTREREDMIWAEIRGSTYGEEAKKGFGWCAKWQDLGRPGWQREIIYIFFESDLLCVFHTLRIQMGFDSPQVSTPKKKHHPSLITNLIFDSWSVPNSKLFF